MEFLEVLTKLLNPYSRNQVSVIHDSNIRKVSGDRNDRNLTI
jgi:hypothetical protein